MNSQKKSGQKRNKLETRKCARADKRYTIHNNWNARIKIEREITRLKNDVLRLESQVNSHNSQILDLRTKSMIKNVIVNGVETFSYKKWE